MACQYSFVGCQKLMMEQRPLIIPSGERSLEAGWKYRIRGTARNHMTLRGLGRFRRRSNPKHA